MQIFMIILMIFLIVCALAASFSKNLLNTVLIYMSFSLVMSVIWVVLESPDLAITEAAVGAGITTLLFILTLKKIGGMMGEATTGQGEDELGPLNKEEQNLELTTIEENKGEVHHEQKA